MIETLFALLISLMSVAAPRGDSQECQAISGQHADGTPVGVVVINCDPGGVLPATN